MLRYVCYHGILTLTLHVLHQTVVVIDTAKRCGGVCTAVALDLCNCMFINKAMFGAIVMGYAGRLRRQTGSFDCA